uniref:CCHC-type domain-containing protein n=1 Tax=Caenorhabditis japonica TaxID=281687 RepID=A0A8R1EAD9_CAEJA
MSIPVKYSVLKRLLTGGAAILITTSTFSEEDYYNTLNLLRVTYATDRRQSVMRKFRQAQFHATNYDEMERDLIIHVTLANKLKIHGVQVDNPMVIDEFIQKLPYHIMTSIIKKTKDNNHTFEEIIRLVRDQIGISRYVEQARDKKKLSEVVNEVYVTKGNFSPRRSGNDYYKRKNYERKSCPYCDGNHHPNACEIPRFNKLSKIREANRCVNCLGYGHKKSDCRSIGKCVHCEQDHHTSLCTRRGQIDVAEKISETRPPPF